MHHLYYQKSELSRFRDFSIPVFPRFRDFSRCKYTHILDFYRCFLKKLHYKKIGNHWNIQLVWQHIEPIFASPSLLKNDHLPDFTQLLAYFAHKKPKESMKYAVVIRETLCRTVVVEATDEPSALRQVEEQYRQSQIVLDADDFERTEFLTPERAE
jgi:hypothetical protein